MSDYHVSLILPTLNEAENLPSLIAEIDLVLREWPHELIVCDGGSTDGTIEVSQELAATRPHMRLLEPGGGVCLSEAILHGFDNATGRLLGVMDADHQHDPQTLKLLIGSFPEAELAIGTRYMLGGGTEGWSRSRRLQSKTAGWLTRKALGITTRDPLSGCFMIDRHAFEGLRTHLKPRGWKLLLDFLGQDPGMKVVEVPLVFRKRSAGESKIGAHVVREWLAQLLDIRRRARA